MNDCSYCAKGLRSLCVCGVTAIHGRIDEAAARLGWDRDTVSFLHRAVARLEQLHGADTARVLTGQAPRHAAMRRVCSIPDCGCTGYEHP